MRPLTVLALAIALAACREEAAPADADGDGVDALTDCDDNDRTVFPGAEEVCNDLDDDCDGVIDNPSATDASTWYMDADADGFGVSGVRVVQCDAPAGYVDNDGDCNDASNQYYPGATENNCLDPNDYNCDGSVGYADADGDGYAACRECDDAVTGVNPGAAEVCDGLDNNCDGAADVDALDALPWYADADADGYGDALAEARACTAPAGYVADDQDCDDALSDVYPGAREYCNQRDDDCNGDLDDDAVDARPWYGDADDDGYGVETRIERACEEPAGYAAVAEDCDDLDPSAHPEGMEVCDGADNDCNGLDDDAAIDMTAFYADLDRDGFGDAEASLLACDLPAGYTENPDDCDDSAASAFPGGTEVCDGRDNNCDGAADESGLDAPTWYADADADGYGDAAVTQRACAMPEGFAASTTDCDDARATAFPGAPETCNALDDDCDRTADEDATDAPTWYADSDSDGFGGTRFTVRACDAPAGYLADHADCNDLAASAHPGGTEVCDGLDNDCDVSVDEDATDAPSWYPDADADGYGDASAALRACRAPAGYVSNALDACADADAHPSVHLGATEVCDGLDNDCNGTADAGAVDAATWYTDSDGDGYGLSAAPLRACAQPAGTSVSGGDCDDTTAARAPGLLEVCDGLDNNCNTAVDDYAADASTWYGDADGDGYGVASVTRRACAQPADYAALTGDCDDLSDANYPGATEVCDAVDNNCNSVIDLDAAAPPVWFQDYDDDSYGNPRYSQAVCAQPAGYVSNDDDCNDVEPLAWPNADEVCDDIDNDCDGVIDNPEALLGEEADCAALSCEDAFTTLDSSSSGVYWLDPQGDGVGAFDAWCDMSLASGGWTLLGVFSNGDGAKHWTPYHDTWISSASLGSPASPSTNADAKSPAWAQLPVNDVMIVSYPSTIWVRTTASCLADHTMQEAFQRNSEADANCALSCATATVAGPWATGGTTDYTDNTLRFRCRDTNGGTSYVGGYNVSTDDNSMLTTMVFPTYLDYNFGLGAGYGSATTSAEYVDWDVNTNDMGTGTDTTQILLYGR